MRIALSEANVFQVQLNNILIKCEIGLTNSHRINQKLREVSFLFNNLENSYFSPSICSEYRAELYSRLESKNRKREEREIKEQAKLQLGRKVLFLNMRHEELCKLQYCSFSGSIFSKFRISEDVTVTGDVRWALLGGHVSTSFFLLRNIITELVNNQTLLQQCGHKISRNWQIS